MGYTSPVKFSKTNLYGRGKPSEDDVYTVKGFIDRVKSGLFIDDDGCGHPVKNGKADRNIYVFPSEIDRIPKDATHIVWYNK